MLTFSNKAAEELRERVQVYAPEAAPQIEIGTFHSFGLEFLRRYWQPAGLDPRPTILDPVDALFILERHLPELNLDHYQNIYEPTKHLSSILAAISRAKDELCTPDNYKRLAQKMLDEAQASGDKEALRRAGRALEVARVYEVYQAHLEREGLLDFGDLIARTVRLLRESPTTCNEAQSKYRHVLVDEYQDVNRACGVLLGLLTKDGAGLWTVGDTRQAIYRWRGAAPAQVKHFRRDFPAGQIMPLTVNYRSLPSIVEAVSTFAVKMSVTASSGELADDENFAAWEAHRQHIAQTNEATSEDAGGDSKALRFEIATNAETEVREIARLIKERHRRGAPYKSRAIICRKHSHLAKFAKGLEAENVPALYLGDIFERSEVRDLLAFVALACEPSGRTLLRIARFAEYDIPLADVRAMYQAAREAGVEFPAALTNSFIEHDANITRVTKAAGVARLANHLARVAHIPSVWKLLTHYLFIHSRYLAPLLADTTIAGAQKRLAIYQLLQFTYTQADRAVTITRDTDARRALLAYARRLKMLAEDKALRQAPAAAANLDAVHLVTVHAAKGLEWDAVYLPHLGKGYFPDKRKPELCQPPFGMTETFDDRDDAPDTHNEEEECLFFVALSRARDSVCLTRATAYGRSNSKASEFLDVLAAHLPRDAHGAVTWHDDAPPIVSTALPNSQSTAPRFSERALANYLKCPRKYFYENVLYLRGKSEESAYVRFHACVYDVLRLLANEKWAGRIHDIEQASQLAHRRLVEVWRERGLAGHIYESLYYEQARLMIERAVHRITRARGTLIEQRWTITRPHALITVTLDHIELVEDADGATLLMQHTRTGRPPSKPPDDSLYGLYYALAAEHFPTARPRVEVLYLSTDETIVLDLKPRTVLTRLAHYDEAIDRILAGEFPHLPSEHACPRCAHYFTCPKAEDGKQGIVDN